VSQSRYLNIPCYRRSEFKSALIKSDSRGWSDDTKPIPDFHILSECQPRSLQDPKMQSKSNNGSKFKLRVHYSFLYQQRKALSQPRRLPITGLILINLLPLQQINDMPFSFENHSRNTHLTQSKGLSGATARSTGTTIVGCIYDGGIVLGADTRATEGPIIADKNCEKIHYISDSIYCCGAVSRCCTRPTLCTY
jgi:hypothetical protein